MGTSADKADSAGRRLRRSRKAPLAIALLLAGLVAADRALVLWPAHWAWVAREMPVRVSDPYRVEALLRSTPPGRRNVPILGNSLAERGLDPAELERRFAAQGLRFPSITIGSGPALAFGMLANSVADLEPRAAIFVAGPLSLRSLPQLHRVRVYDLRSVPDLFSARDVLREPGFHVAGLFGELSVLLRHGRALRNAARVRLGLGQWDPHGGGPIDARSGEYGPGSDSWLNWIREPVPDSYPNANTRALAYLSRRLRESGARLLVIDAPVLATSQTQSVSARIDRYRQFLLELSAEAGFELLEPDPPVVYRPEDFLDGVHPSDSGRARFTAALIESLGDRLERDQGVEGRAGAEPVHR